MPLSFLTNLIINIMKKYLLLFCLSFFILAAKAQENIAKADSGTFFLHKFEQHIGKETYHITKTGKNIIYKNNNLGHYK